MRNRSVFSDRGIDNHYTSTSCGSKMFFTPVNTSRSSYNCVWRQVTYGGYPHLKPFIEDYQAPRHVKTPVRKSRGRPRKTVSYIDVPTHGFNPIKTVETRNASATGSLISGPHSADTDSKVTKKLHRRPTGWRAARIKEKEARVHNNKKWTSFFQRRILAPHIAAEQALEREPETRGAESEIRNAEAETPKAPAIMTKKPSLMLTLHYNKAEEQHLETPGPTPPDLDHGKTSHESDTPYTEQQHDPPFPSKADPTKLHTNGIDYYTPTSDPQAFTTPPPTPADIGASFISDVPSTTATFSTPRNFGHPTLTPPLSAKASSLADADL